MFFKMEIIDQSVLEQNDDKVETMWPRKVVKLVEFWMQDMILEYHKDIE